MQNKPKKCRVFTPDQPLRILASDNPGDCFVLLYRKGKGLILTLSEDRLLYDDDGFGFACVDETLMWDTTTRPGVGFFSLPENHWSQIAAAIHDYKTSSRAYMLTHNRSEAEADFRRHLESVSTTTWRSIVGDVMGGITYTLSWLFWDVKKTRWK